MVRCVDNFLRVCVLDMPVSIALRHSEMLYFEICRLMLERTGKFPKENVFFNRTWSKDNVFQQLQEVLHEAASDAQVLINAGKRRSSVIIAAVNYVEQHYTENISLKQMAEDIFVSPPYLSNLFKEKMGVNVTAYIHEVRIEKSKKLLLDSTWSIQQIAEQVGYRNEKHFMQMFKKICGMTPSQFRFKKTQ